MIEALKRSYAFIFRRTKTIQANSIATFDYRFRNLEGRIVESGWEVVYLHGHSTLPSGMEKSLKGQAVGDKVYVELSPEMTYGFKSDGQPIHRHRSDIDGEIDSIEPGFPMTIQDDDGQEIKVYVLETNGDDVSFSRDHPLAGMPLIFEADILDIRDALPEELESKTPFGRYGDESPTGCEANCTCC